jgi:hypothetical protein
MLSRMLSMHPEVLSLSAFWNCFTDAEGSVPTHEMSGAEFWQRLTEPAGSFDGLVRAGVQQDDLARYQTRYDYASGVPPICRVLEAISGDAPDAVFDALDPEVPSWPRRPVAEHCRALFGDLAVRLGRRVIVERTGGSVGYLDLLREMFPDARFVFLYRDGPDTALSMSRHPEMRLAALRIIAEAVGGPAPEKWTTLRYEALLQDTRAELTRLAGFIGAGADRQWLDDTCALADSGRMGPAAAQLHPVDLAALRTACAAGRRAFDLLESEHISPTTT